MEHRHELRLTSVTKTCYTSVLLSRSEMVFSFPTWLPASLESLSFCVDFVKGRATQVCKQSTEQVTQQLLEVTAPLLTFNTEKSSRNPALWCFIMGQE